MTTGRINQVIRESAVRRAPAPAPRFAPTGARAETNPLDHLTENRGEKAYDRRSTSSASRTGSLNESMGNPGRLPSASDDLRRPPSGRRPCLAQEAGNPLSAQHVCTRRSVIWIPGTPHAVWTSDSVFARSVPRLRPVSPMSPLT
jgi:hypothetical protein